MDAALPAAPLPGVTLSKRSKWIGRVLSGIPVAFLLFDAAMKIVLRPEVAEASQQLGLPANVNPTLGAVLLASLVLYLTPRVAPLGAMLLTGYLGGAVAMHVRVGDPLFSHVLSPVYVGVMLWAGLMLRDSRVRRLFAVK